MKLNKKAGGIEVHSQEELFDRFYDRLPKEFVYERELFKSRVWRSPDYWELEREG
jgi:phosphoenolpyruvate carboxykinase (GTP)